MEALLYEKLADLKVRCALCSHRCIVADGKRGICNVRENQGGVLHTLVYGRLIARHIDPSKKSPFTTSCRAHFPIPSPPWGATSAAGSARTPTLLSYRPTMAERF